MPLARRRTAAARNVPIAGGGRRVHAGRPAWCYAGVSLFAAHPADSAALTPRLIHVRTFSPKPAHVQRVWYEVDADAAVFGGWRARRRVRQHKPIFAPNQDTGDHVIVVNAAKIQMTALPAVIWILAAFTTITWSPVSWLGAKIGLCLPRRTRATSLASRPKTAPSASTSYQTR